MKYHLTTDHIRVERKSLGPTHPFICYLPPPPSTNHLFANVPGRGRYRTREYNDWIETAGMVLKAKRPPKFTAQVWISITYSDEGRFDLNNRDKALVDLLVKCGVIVNDTRQYLRELRLAWGNVTGARIEIRPFPFADRVAV